LLFWFENKSSGNPARKMCWQNVNGDGKVRKNWLGGEEVISVLPKYKGEIM
jgi:hypothetical protein